MFKNKEDYLEQRNALLNEAEELLEEGKLDEYKEKEQEIKELDNEFEAFAKAQANINALQDNQPANMNNTISDKGMNLPGDEARKLAEKRGKELKKNNVVTVSSSDVVIPDHKAEDIRPGFNEVSSLLDRVYIKPLKGGESFEQPYIKGYGEGDYTEEEEDYAEAEPTFGYAQINKAKITAYAEDTEELQKLPAADYDAEVMRGVRIASRKKITRQILVGGGSTNQLVGIFTSEAEAIDSSTDKELAEIDNNTLDEIIFSYGGDEEVEDAAVLILNKLDLKAFSQLRTDDGKKFHDIQTNGNTGTIDGIPFIINSACKAISDSDTATDDYCMAYGPLSNYMLAIFSDTEVKRSEDYKFKQGVIAHRGSTFLGGNVVSHNGFLRVKKASEA